ncbi:unnamed protein product [Zymoseptoria tritici ST99CH_1A5]|uniref:Uncharacterized protein n=1 Tax=Zymoseptoria tritici ST99CH_1A5 TaxID=1276529 RepID=A0A1Y6LF43_ZYMTR|nr:unnamed protein product [Zymoseptoria tritici ST99CH_1A5]
MSDSKPWKPLTEENLVQISRSTRSCVPSRATITPNDPLEGQVRQFTSLVHDVLYTSGLATLNGSHRVAAWNALCSVIDQAIKSDLPELDDALWTLDIWTRILDIYLGHAQTVRPKSSRQLMATLTKALQKSTSRDLISVKRTITERLVQCLLDFQDPFRARVSAQLLGHLLLKDVATVEDVLAAFQRSSADDSDSGFETKSTRMLVILFQWLGKGDFSSTISQFVSILLDQIDASTGSAKSSDEPLWAGPLARAFGRGAVNLDDMRVHLLPALFKRSFADFQLFLRMQGLESIGTPDRAGDNGASQELLFAALQTGKEMGLLHETEALHISYDSNVLLLPVRTIGLLVRRSSRAARLTGLSLLTTSHSATRPIPLTALNIIRQNLDILFADVDADFRSGVFSALQRLIDRIRAITAVLERQGNQSIPDANSSGAKHTLQYHKTFLKQLLDFLSWELRPTASYQRHISSLKCISFLARSGLDGYVPKDCLSKTALGETKWPFRIRVVTEDVQRLLLDLLMDPFDDVRQTSASILGYYSSTTTSSGLLNKDCVATTLDKAEAIMLATSRADHADGVAHLYAICYQRCRGDTVSENLVWESPRSFLDALVSKLDLMALLAETSLAKAVQKYPMHGLLTSLRYIVLQDPNVVDAELSTRLFELVVQVWNIVKPILCDDAPEGFVPDALEMSPESTKETLSYCWRALKEASLLLSTLVSSPGASADPALLERMSNLCYTQLAELRHRGAFSTVAQTWTSCCTQCHDLKESASGVCMLNVWYAKVLDMLKNNVTINTRRSAGLPSLLCGILIPDKSGHLLAQAFTDMEAIARQDVNSKSAEEGSLAQVHAMNCLKDILKTTRLGERTQQYIPTALQLAADSLRSEVWAVRNCGLMLFRAVIDRLLGTNEAHLEDDVVVHKRISAEQHPALLDVLLGLLPKQVSTSEALSTRYEGVFPALQLLQYTQIPESRLTETRDAVADLTASPSWHVRDKAARTLAALMESDHIQEQLGILLRNDITTSHNRSHGALLTVKYMMTRLTSVSTPPTSENVRKARLDPEDTWLHLLHAVTEFQLAAPSYIVKAACLDVVSLMLQLIAETIPSQDLSVFHDFNIDFDVESHHTSDAAVLRQAWARYAARRIRYGRFDDQNEPLGMYNKVLHLARGDTDAGCCFLEAVDWTFARECSSRCDDDCGVTIGWFCADVLRDVTLRDPRLNSLAYKVLLSLKTEHGELLRTETVGLLIEQEAKSCFADSTTNQTIVDQTLNLRALQLEEMAGTAEATEEATFKWANQVTAAIAERGIHTREAGATALSRIIKLWKHMSLPVWTDLTLAVYDLLNDDDEDVRLLAAEVVPRILSSIMPSASPPGQQLEPIAASQSLLVVLHKRYSPGTDASHLTSIALYRGFDFQPMKNTSLSVAEQLTSLSNPDTALFAQEKQNLFLDHAREVRIWAKFLHRLPPPTWTESEMSSFTHWIHDGLTALSAAELEEDGPLGWSTKQEEMFTLGLRVILGVEVLFYWVSQGTRLPLRPSDLRMKVFEVVKVWEVRKVNCLWRGEMERVLAEAVLGQTKAVDGIARFVAGEEGRKLI